MAKGTYYYQICNEYSLDFLIKQHMRVYILLLYHDNTDEIGPRKAHYNNTHCVYNL